MFRRISGVFIAMFFAVSAQAATVLEGEYIALLRKTNLSVSAPHVILGTADTIDDITTTNLTGINATWVPPTAYSIAGLEYDGSFRTLLQLQIPLSTNPDPVIGATALTFNDVVNTSLISQSSPWVPPTAYDISGIAYDGKYRIVMPLVDPITANPGFLITADTWQDVLDANFSSAPVWDPMLPEGYRLAGFTYDGMYRMLLEELDQFSMPGKPDVILRTFESFADVESGNFLGDEAATWVPPSAYDIQGFAFVPDPVQPPMNVVPLPAGLPLYLGALIFGFGILRRVPTKRHTKAS